MTYQSYAGVCGPEELDPVLFHLPWAIVFNSDDPLTGGRNDCFCALESSPWVHTFDHLRFYRSLTAELAGLE